MYTLLAFAALLSAPPRDTSDVAAAMRASLDAPLLLGARWQDIADVRVGVQELYAARSWSPLWTTRGRLSPAGKAVLRELGTAHYRGLVAADYDAERLLALADSLSGRLDERVGRFDVLLSVAVARYASALERGRIDPRELHPTLRLAREPFETARVLSELSGSDRPAAVFRALEPSFFQYRRLQSVLVTYRLLAQDSARLVLPTMPPRLRLGMAYAGASQLRKLLRLVGDLTESSAIAREAVGDTIYDLPLVDAVRRFQRRQGFGADGVIGDSTRSRLNRTFGDRVRQIELTLERWRWLPRQFDTPPLIVNIPEFRLAAFKGAEDLESETLTLDVVVGTAVKNDTPLLAVEMTAIQFHPPWNVPTSIMREEIRPKALKDSTFLERENYELLRGNTVVPIVDSNVTRIGYAVRVRQKPGVGNALGRVKFVMPNTEDIYLHDTPSKAHFARVRRDFSHGCIRVSNPALLAAFLLRDNPRWTRERVDSMMAGDSTLWVPLTKRIPVYLVYQSAVVRESGETFFFGDVYGHDRSLDRVLRKGYPYVRPQPATVVTKL